MDSSTVETAHVKYVYLDIVGFTKDRSVEAQSDLVAALNEVVRGALQKVSIPMDKTVLIPTGDGMAIALIEIAPYDIHLAIALEILRLVTEHNAQTKDRMRQFEVRIGINENTDNLVLDINGKQNVAGQGISLAQRIMDKADGGQVLIGQTVYETLRPREKYMSSFKSFSATAKHGITFQVHQYLAKDVQGLNVDTPFAFAPKKIENPKFTEFVAYFVAHAHNNSEFLVSRKDDSTRDYVATVLLSFLADDSIGKSKTQTHDAPVLITWNAGVAPFAKQYDFYSGMDFWVLARFAPCIEKRLLEKFAEYFEYSSYEHVYWLPKRSALEKLCKEYPAIAAEFEITVS